MYRRYIALFLAFSLIFICIVACGNKKASKKLIAEVNYPSILKIQYTGDISTPNYQICENSSIQGSFTVSPDNKRIAYGVQPDIGKKSFVLADNRKGRKYYYVEHPIFSPDSKHLAYVALVGDIFTGKFFVVLDEKEDKQYDEVETLIFSPDSKRLAYAAKIGDKCFMVVDGE